MNEINDHELTTGEERTHVRFKEAITSVKAPPQSVVSPSDSGFGLGEEEVDPLEGEVDPLVVPEKPADMPEWMEFKDPASGSPYWVNTLNGDSVVEKPANLP